jgi:hypothetical protein
MHEYVDRHEPEVGHVWRVLPSRCRTVERAIAFHRGQFRYVGITSSDHADHVAPLLKRVDFYKRTNGAHYLFALYRTTSRRNAQLVETRLIEKYRERLANRVVGSPGKMPERAYSFVYLAFDGEFDGSSRSRP